MNLRTIAKLLRQGVDNASVISSGDLATGSVPSAQLAAAAALSADGSLSLQTGITPREGGGYPVHHTVLQFTNQAVTISDTNAYGSLEVYDFPSGVIAVLASAAKFTFTTTTTIASTLNSGVTVQWGVGTAAASATTLATTMIDLAPGTGQTVPTFTSSTTIDVAPTAATAYLKASTAPFDGTSAAKKAYLNFALATATDIDADATLAVNGVLELIWVYGGTYGLTYTP